MTFSNRKIKYSIYFKYYNYYCETYMDDKYEKDWMHMAHVTMYFSEENHGLDSSVISRAGKQFSVTQWAWDITFVGGEQWAESAQFSSRTKWVRSVRFELRNGPVNL